MGNLYQSRSGRIAKPVRQGTISHQVQIHFARAKPLPLPPANLTLDLFERLNQRPWAKLGPKLNDAVEERRLILDVHRRGFVKIADSLYSPERRHRCDRRPQMRFAVAQIRADGDKRSDHCREVYPARGPVRLDFVQLFVQQ